MALVNTLFVQWARGRTRVTDAPSVAQWGRHADFLDVGAAQSEEDAVRIALAVLEARAQPAVTTTLQLVPRYSGDVPSVDVDLGDYVTAQVERAPNALQQMRALTTGDGREGGVEWVPELRSVQAVREQSVSLWLKRMAMGALGGTSRSASPSPGPNPPGPAPTKEAKAFSQSAVVVEESARWTPPVAMRISRLVASLSTVGAGPTNVMVKKNGATVAAAGGYLGLAAFHWEGVAGFQGLRVSIDLDPTLGDYLTMAVTAAGVGAQGLLIDTTGV